MASTAKVEATYDDGSPKTLRDNNDCLWRVAIDGADGTLAVEEIEDGDPFPEDAETVGMAPCGVARWNQDNTLEISRATHGENHTDPSSYAVGGTDLSIATPSGWQSGEQIIEALRDRVRKSNSN